MYQQRAREYDPSIGRFWEQDVLGCSSNTDPLSLHKYLFCDGNPGNRLDISGRMSTSEIVVVTGIGLILSSILLGSLGAFGKISKPSFGLSMIPIVGSAWDAMYEFQQGNIGWGAFYTALAVSDLFLVKYIVSIPVKLLSKLTQVGLREVATDVIPHISASGWKTLLGGIRIQKVGGFFVKEIDPAAKGFSRWFAETTLEEQVRALKALGPKAPRFFYENGRLTIEDAGKFSGGFMDFLATRWTGSLALGEIINDVAPRNIGAAGLIFDPALHPLDSVVRYFALYLLWRSLSIGFDYAHNQQ